MNTGLLAKLGSLSSGERHYFYKRLMDVLNDRYSCFVYGGMNNVEYATMPKDKLEILEINLYNHMFKSLEPPMRNIIESFHNNKRLEKLDSDLVDLSKINPCKFITTKKSPVYSAGFQN